MDDPRRVLHKEGILLHVTEDFLVDLYPKFEYTYKPATNYTKIITTGLI